MIGANENKGPILTDETESTDEMLVRARKLGFSDETLNFLDRTREFLQENIDLFCKELGGNSAGVMCSATIKAKESGLIKDDREEKLFMIQLHSGFMMSGLQHQMCVAEDLFGKGARDDMIMGLMEMISNELRKEGRVSMPRTEEETIRFTPGAKVEIPETKFKTEYKATFPDNVKEIGGKQNESTGSSKDRKSCQDP